MQFSDCMILLHTLVECDNASIPIIICLVCLNITTGDKMLSLDECILFICEDFACCLCMYGMQFYVLGWL